MEKVIKRNKGRRFRSVYRKVLIVLLSLLLVGGTFAVMTAVLIPLTNNFSFGKTTPKIDEDFDGWDHKKVRLQNEPGEDRVKGVVRCMILPVIRDKTTGEIVGGSNVALGDPGASNVLVLGDLEYVFTTGWQSDWFYRDGYFYYRKVLAPGEYTPYLLQQVRPGASMTPAVADTLSVDIEVMCDILQAEGGAPESAWGVYITGGGTTVSPTP